MNRRLILCIAAALTVGACSDQQEPTSESQNPGSDFASASSTVGINVVLKGRATAAQLAELSKYGIVRKQFPQINGLTLAGKAGNLASIRRLRFVKGAAIDKFIDIPPNTDLVNVTDFTSGFSSWDQDAIDVTIQPLSSAREALLVADEVAAAPYFSQILRTADIRHHVEGRVEGAAEESFAANRTAERHEGDDPADPRHRSHQSSRHPAGRILPQLFAHSHARHMSKPRSLAIRLPNRRGSAGRSAPSGKAAWTSAAIIADTAGAQSKGAIVVAIVWQFTVRPGREAEFERFFGADGEWTAANRHARSYLGSSFLRDQSLTSRYLVVEYWSEMLVYEQHKVYRS